MAYSSSVYAQNWTAVPGGATDIGANARGDVWVIGANSVLGGHGIYHLINGNFQNVPGGASRIAVDTDGSAWVVNNTNNILHGSGNGQWTTAPGGATDIGVGANGDVWIIGADRSGNDYGIYKALFSPGTKNVTSWQRVDGGAIRIAVDPNGIPWVVNSSGNIFQRQGNSWAQVSGGAQDIAIGADGTVYVVGTSPSVSGGIAVWQYQGNNNWKQLNIGAANIAAGPTGVIYVAQDSSKQYAILTNRPLPTAIATPGLVASTPSTPAASTEPHGFTEFCWRDTHGRGVGTPLSTNSSDCPAGFAKDPTGLLCYPNCKPGYRMAGPVCWQECPAGFPEAAADCGKPQAYGRGAGYAWQIGDKPFDSGGQFSRCQNDNSQGCEQPGGGITLVYPKCKANFHAVGTNICSPDCPTGMQDMGAMCQRNSYTNGVGEPLGCPKGLEKSGLLCYSGCGANSDGVGPVCWDRCPANWVQCGAGCSKTIAKCGEAITDQVVSVLSAAAMIASEVLTAGGAAGIVEAGKSSGQATKMADATKQASEMVEKLNLTEVLKNMKQAGTADSATVRSAVANAMKPTKLTAVEKGVDVAGGAANFFTTIADVADNSNLTQDQKNWQIAQTVLQTTSLVDPTGIAGVVAAYTKPLCSVVTQTASNEIFDLDNAERQNVRRELLGAE